MSLYNCKIDGDQYRITKFTNDLEVEASYLTNGRECDCPAGHRPACRHRIMLSRFIAKDATAGQWFHAYEHQQWVRAAADETTIGDLEEDTASAASELTATEVDERIRNHSGPIPGETLVGEVIDNAMKPINLLALAEPTPQGFNKEMQRALEADGEKLKQLTSEDHGPTFLPEPKPLRRL